MTLTIWHNPRCSKSRQTLAILEDKGLSPDVRLYLEDAPTVAEITDALQKLGLSAGEIIRKGEAEYAEQGLTATSSDTALIEAMSTASKLIERPIVFSGDKAKIGRPPEGVLDIL